MMSDTSKDAAALRRASLAAMSGPERLQQALDLSQFVSEFSAAGARLRAAEGADEPREEAVQPKDDEM